MGLFDILSGKIEYFNNTAVPVYNEIAANIRQISGEREKLLFVIALGLIAQKGIDLFFKPGKGPVLKDIKLYNQKDFNLLYSVFIIWAFYDFLNAFGSGNKDTFNKTKLQYILKLERDEFDYYFNQLNHGDKPPVGLEKLWKEIVKIVHTMPNTPENYLVFAREFSGVCREGFQVGFEQILGLTKKDKNNQ